MHWTLNKSLLVAFGAINAIMVVIASIVWWEARGVDKAQHQVVAQDQPKLLICTELEQGIQESLAALRGYMLLGKDKFAKQRAGAWAKQAERQERMRKLAGNDAETRAFLDRLRSVLARFAAAQQDCEDIYHKSENQPARHLMITRVHPTYERMLHEIQAIIDAERSNSDTEAARNNAIHNLTAALKSLAETMTALEEFAMAGSSKAAQKYSALLTKTQRTHNAIRADRKQFSSEQAAHLDKYLADWSEVQNSAARVIEIRSGKDWNKGNAILAARAIPAAAEASRIIESIRAKQNARVAEATSELASRSSTLIWSVIIATLIGVIGGGILAYAIARRITSSLRELSQELRVGADRTTEAANEVQGTSRSVAQAAAEQAASLEETSASLEQMDSITRNNAENAAEANSLASQARTASEEGSSAMHELSTAMEQITDSGAEMSKIVKNIEGIAFQTNLLALNAAVEAARAGEHGKGFAVVAEEVRNLAQRAAESARNTSALIDESNGRIETGMQLTQRAATSLDSITDASRKTAELIAEIATAGSEVAQGIDQVNRAVSEMDSVTQQNAASSEEAAASSHHLTDYATRMNRIVEDLTRLVGTSDNQVQRPAVAGKTNAKSTRSAPVAQTTNDKPAAPLGFDVDGQESLASQPKQTSAAAREMIPFDADDFTEF